MKPPEERFSPNPDVGKTRDSSAAPPTSDNVTDSTTADSMDAARSVLNRVRRAASERGAQRQTSSSKAPGSLRRKRPEDSSDASSATGRDPQYLSQVLGRVVTERGWSSPVAVGSVIARWAELVGPEIASHCQPESFEGTILQVRCDSTAWASQLRILGPQLLDHFHTTLGQGVVSKIDVLGPVAPNWRKGRRSVNGRGPRDTFG